MVIYFKQVYGKNKQTYLIMESGANPEQSGYCDVENFPLCHCLCGKTENLVKLSQDTY